jgi:hypothetical protein
MSDYCFVLGCARSGTTALTRLLHAHDNVVIGMERYKYRLGGAALDTFRPDLFEVDRFLDFRDDDTNITPSVDRFRKHYDLAEERLRQGDVRYIGDKVAARRQTATAIQHRFANTKVVFIYRDLLRVASSFCVRARNPDDTNWPETSTHEVALARWNEAFEAAAVFLDGPAPEDLFVVRYERLFNGDSRTCEAMFRFLGLDVTPDVDKHFTAATAHWDEHESKQLELTEQQQQFLLDELDQDRLDRFDRAFDRHVETFAPA